VSEKMITIHYVWVEASDDVGNFRRALVKLRFGKVKKNDVQIEVWQKEKKMSSIHYVWVEASDDVGNFGKALVKLRFGKKKKKMTSIQYVWAEASDDVGNFSWRPLSNCFGVSEKMISIHYVWVEASNYVWLKNLVCKIARQYVCLEASDDVRCAHVTWGAD
jgi:hypothetical protein